MYGTRFEVRRFEELDSTNRYLLDEARNGAPEGLVAMADHQTAGRGRLGRRWEAPAGASLLVSVLLRPSLPPAELHLCTVALALAARSACARGSGVEAGLKWPNDLIVGERKLAGILAEVVDAAVVVGIGVNVAWPPPEAGPTEATGPSELSGPAGVPVPEELAQATSLWRQGGTRIEPVALLELLLDDLDRRLDDLATGAGRRRLASDYRSACSTLGRRVTVTLEGETVTGAVTDITTEGHLLVDVGACIRTITAGDVVHLRT